MSVYQLQELLGERPVEAKLPVLVELDDIDLRKRSALLRKKDFAVFKLPQASGKWTSTCFLREDCQRGNRCPHWFAAVSPEPSRRPRGHRNGLGVRLKPQAHDFRGSPDSRGMGESQCRDKGRRCLPVGNGGALLLIGVTQEAPELIQIRRDACPDGLPYVGVTSNRDACLIDREWHSSDTKLDTRLLDHVHHKAPVEFLESGWLNGGRRS